VRLFTRRGYDWSDRYPDHPGRAQAPQDFIRMGKPWSFGPDGISDFAKLYFGKGNAEVRLYAFDLLADDGVDMRDETLQVRKPWTVALFALD
jgi:bifunctional non-homologous end joining protein LigD